MRKEPHEKHAAVVLLHVQSLDEFAPLSLSFPIC